MANRKSENQIALPILEASRPMELALDVMLQRRLSGVIVKDHSIYGILTAEKIAEFLGEYYEGARSKTPPLSLLDATIKAPKSRANIVRGYGATRPNLRQERFDPKSYFKSSTGEYLFFRGESRFTLANHYQHRWMRQGEISLGLVFTRTPQLMATLRDSPNFCRCTNPNGRRHSMSHNDHRGVGCPFDGSSMRCYGQR